MISSTSSRDIHPTAIVHPRAVLGEGVRIGPYAIIEGPAVIGAGCTIAAHAIITGYVRMGENNSVGYGAIIGGDPQDNAFDPATESWVVIGSHNRIREYVTIHRGTTPGSETRVGNHCFLMGGVHLAHNVIVEDRVILANNALLAGHVQIGAGVFVGGSAVFHQFVRIGRNAVIQGNASIGKDVPPFLIGCRTNRVGGINTIGLRRAGLSAAQRQEIKRAFLLLYKSGLNTTQALAAAREQTWSELGETFFRFVAESKKRGICELRSSRNGGEDGED